MQNLTILKQPTRIAARNTVRNLKSSGKVAKIVDNGSSLKGLDRWAVSVIAVIPSKAYPKRVSKVVKVKNKGFDIRPVTSGVKGYDLFLNGEFILRRDSRIEVYESGITFAQRAKIDYSTLSYK